MGQQQMCEASKYNFCCGLDAEGKDSPLRGVICFLPGIRSKLHSEQSLNDRHILSMDGSVIMVGSRIRGQSEDNVNWALRRDDEHVWAQSHCSSSKKQKHQRGVVNDKNGVAEAVKAIPLK
ncbi:uncharacterized protein LACBIDRAFT_327822 [Laccaria bicolor S238N-H82]|uniref:Predicted protein n=1 Tax=Laccaria bicolor (strain S238N-H82 / ATCC MYA-4686) TaxID=486041 RepID=B0DCY1_LACBS|nr:uncharacterized protein LACBIDRAFT_327822 [Laccaria bicolor S238N-H82]EDR07514.1 predicted protein [Laccaria bicolor S238N-H82]|eukprot:XP_001881906.1 predicted protein [Laccaria bicolor S238N-H82]